MLCFSPDTTVDPTGPHTMTDQEPYTTFDSTGSHTMTDQEPSMLNVIAVAVGSAAAVIALLVATAVIVAMCVHKNKQGDSYRVFVNCV